MHFHVVRAAQAPDLARELAEGQRAAMRPYGIDRIVRAKVWPEAYLVATQSPGGGLTGGLRLEQRSADHRLPLESAIGLPAESLRKLERRAAKGLVEVCGLWIASPLPDPVLAERLVRLGLAVASAMGMRHAVAFGGQARTPVPSAMAREVPIERYGSPVLVTPRLGQGTIRVAVTDAYGRACTVTTEHSLPVLDAAHIRPFASDGPHTTRNGLLLRSDIHRLFDRGYVTVTPEGRFEVSRRLKEDFDNGRTYYEMKGRQIRLPERPEERPDPALLAWHNEHVFLAA